MLAGSELFEMLDAVSQRIVIIISADLAHTHQASGPYGYSNASEPFDMVCFLVSLGLFAYIHVCSPMIALYCIHGGFFQKQLSYHC